MHVNDDIQYIKGIGPKKAEIIRKCGINSIEDILRLVPRSYLNHSQAKPMNQLKADDYVTVIGKILSIHTQLGRKKRLVAHISDGHAVIKAIWFNFIPQVEERLAKGQTVAFRGKVSFFGTFQIVHPEMEIISDDQQFEEKDFILPIYSIPDLFRKIKITNQSIRKWVEEILKTCPLDSIIDDIPLSIQTKHGLLGISEAFHQLHFPRTMEEAERALLRFKYEELFHLQVYLQLRKGQTKANLRGFSYTKVGDSFNVIHSRLPFELSSAQKRVIKEIRNDLKSLSPMNRLLQGDVGSGKTVVAILCMAIAKDNDRQSVLMAPTELLAEQHYKNLLKLSESTQLRSTLLTASLTDKEKKKRLADIANGTVDIVIGTHALIQEKVQFHHLGFIVIDEQHRFGVMQRADLQAKANHPDVLVMTATPIPRTMALTVYGDLDVSILDQRPKDRAKIKTVWRHDGQEKEIYDFIRTRLNNNEQVYFVYPLVDESEKMDLKSAVEAHDRLQNQVFPEWKVGLLHGKMKGDEKDAVMRQFLRNEIQVLVSTTVIEVGIDVANATVMIIEHAERFGLAQLHQLRGRVGRGSLESYCILKTPYRLGEEAKMRLKFCCECDDGFKIADEDLRIRGMGDIFGTKQSGAFEFKVASLIYDQAILEMARNDAEILLGQDPHLRADAHKLLRHRVLNKFKQEFGLLDIS